MSTKDSPTKPSPTTTTKPNRLPAPTLFVGPPSRNTSQLSVSRQGIDVNSSALRPGRDPLTRQKSALAKPHSPQDATDNEPTPAEPFPTLQKPSGKAVDAKWREMQSTLNEVELTAQSSTHVFGASHAAALDELRRAQVELARAWGQGNEEKAMQQATQNANGQQGGPGAVAADVGRFQGAEDIASDRAGKQHQQQQRRRGDTDASASTTLSDESTMTDGTATSGGAGSGVGGGGGGGRSQLEDETAQDIKLASERRAANEAYFRKVDEGVKDVVAKLEVVAEAMRGVEAESRSLWSGSERSSNTMERRAQQGE